MEGPEKSSKNRPSAIDPEFCWWIVHGKGYLELLLFFLNTGFYCIKNIFEVSMSNKEPVAPSGYPSATFAFTLKFP